MIHLRKRGTVSNVIFEGQMVEQVRIFKYLGLIMGDKLISGEQKRCLKFHSQFSQLFKTSVCTFTMPQTVYKPVNLVKVQSMLRRENYLSSFMKQ